MRTIYLSAGHGGNDSGASGNGYIERDLAIEQRQLIFTYLKELGITAIIDDNKNALVQTLNLFRNLVSPNSLLIDLHYNAASPQATGTEVLVPKVPSQIETKLATEIANVVASTLKIKNRGVKTEVQSARGSLGWMRLNGENVLLETCFISNKKDMESYQANKEILAKEIAKTLFNYAKDSVVLYTVVAGDSLSKIATKNKITVEKIKKENNLQTDLIAIGQKLKL